MKDPIEENTDSFFDKMLKNWQRGAEALSKPLRSYLLLRYGAHPKLFPEETEQNMRRRYGFMAIGGGLVSPGELRAQSCIFKAFVENFSKLQKMKKNGEPIIWVDWPVPSIIIRGFHLESFCPYSMMTFSQASGGERVFRYLSSAESKGMSADICGMNRIALGAYFCEDQFKPSALISASNPCDSQVSGNQIFDYYTGVPAYYLDSAYGRDDESISYFARNIWGMIDFLEKFLNRKMDWERLAALVKEMNTANFYLNEVNLAHRSIPSPNLNFLLSSLWFVKVIIPGSPHITKASELLYSMSVKRVNRPSIARQRGEKIRVLLYENMLVFTDYRKWLQKEFGAIVVCDYIGYTNYPAIDCSTRETIIEGIARDKLHMGMLRSTHGTAKLTIDELEYMLDEYAVDCIIFNAHTGCKHNTAIAKIQKDICVRKGIPALFLEVDIFDKRVVTEKMIKKQITEFFISNGLIV